MHLVPILSTLRRHRTAATLIVLEIALTCAIVCNAIFSIDTRLARMHRPSGLAEDELVAVELFGVGTHSDAAAVTARDLVALRAIPGVRDVAEANELPFTGPAWNRGISRDAHDPSPPITATVYMGSQDLLETLGVQLIAGRDFTPSEYVAFDDKDAQPPAVIITRGVAERLFGGESPIGKPLYVSGEHPQTIVGVVDRLARPNDAGGAAQASYAVILPVTMSYADGHIYLLRVDPARCGQVLAAVGAMLDSVDSSRVITHRSTFTELRHAYFAKDRAMAYLLVGVSIALLIVTALGIVGLASFWVQQRTRQIGIRRALGATRADIVRYFQLENFILATFGIVLGMGLAYAVNLWLVHAYQMPRLPASYLPIGAALLWGLGQIAVLAPARRASQIPPAIATRSV